ncbi:MAG: hypothetical protein WAQ05_20980 [Rubrivivax sp.]
MKPFLVVTSLLSTVLAGCAAPPSQNSSVQTEICDVIEPPTGSRVVQKVRCEPKKNTPQPTS